MTNQKEIQDNKTSAFDELKSVEAKIKKMTLSMVLTEVKKLAKLIQKYKVQSNEWLKNVAADDDEIKRIIDWINNLNDVNLDEDDVKIIKDDVRKQFKSMRDEIDRKIKDKPEFIYSSSISSSTSASTSTAAGFSAQTTSGDNVVLCNTHQGVEIQ